ncbi:hypothetical protein ABK040_012004 [Willaertia magna]
MKRNVVEVNNNSGNENNLPSIFESILSEDTNTQLQGVTALRKLEMNTPVDEILQSDEILPTLIKFLSFDSNPNLQVESIWAIDNIVALGQSHHVQTVVNTGVVPLLITKLLKSPSENVVEKSIWALGNIAGDSVQFRDLVLNTGAIPPLLEIIENSKNISILRHATWTIYILFRGNPKPAKELTKGTLPILAKLLYSYDESVVCNTAQALFSYSNGSEDRIQDIIDSCVCRKLSELLMCPNDSIVAPVLSIFGNIATGNDTQTQIIIYLSVLSSLFLLMSHKKISIRKEACWTISNICGGNTQQIQSVIEANIIPKVIKILSNEKENRKVKQEAIWIIGNLFANGSKAQIDYVIGLDCMSPIIELLGNNKNINNNTLSVVLSTIKKLLELGSSTTNNPYIECIESWDGFEKVKLFSNHNCSEITSLVFEILNYKTNQ